MRNTKSRILSMILVLAMVFSLVAFDVFAADGDLGTEDVNSSPVAKVGNTEYAKIDEAIANWTNGTTLTLLADVTLSDVITLKSTEHHILNLGTFTMTAASGKNAIEITCQGRTSASYALTVNADADNPGGITATGKSCIYYKKSDTTKDRPIILINNGVFTGSYSLNLTSNGNTNCPQIWINGGIFNSYINLTKCMLKVSGGTFHGSINCTGDQNAYRQFSGGRFKNWQFMTADASNKFAVSSEFQKDGNGNWIGTYDVGLYVDAEGYLVVGGPVITELSAQYPAVASNATGWSSYLKYSSAATYGLFYEDPDMAIAKHGASNVTIYEEPTPEATYVAEVNGVKYATLDEAFAAAKDGDTILLLADAAPALTSQRLITEASVIDLNDKTLTLTEDDLYFGSIEFQNGKIVVAPSVKASTAVFWMFADQTLTFDDVDLVATGVSGTYLIGINGGGTGTEINVVNSTITIDNASKVALTAVICDNGTGNSVVIDKSTINVNNLDGRVYLGGENGIITVDDSTLDLNGVKEGFYIRAGQTLTIAGTSDVDIVLNSNEGRYGINITAESATYTKADTATVNTTLYKPVTYVAEVNGVEYATLSEAFAAVSNDNDTVTILADVTENLTGAYLRGNIVGNATITLTNSDWVYCPYTFVIGEGITLNVPALFYYAGGSVIRGTVVTDAYYQRYAGTKLTIEAPGSLTVKSETCIIRYMDGDPNAGIYIVGDNDDSTVELELAVAYFYQGMINAKDATIVCGTYWQTNETDRQGSANIVLDNSKLTVTVYDHPAKVTGNSTVTLKNGSVMNCQNGGFEYGENAILSVDVDSFIIGKNDEEIKIPLSGSGTAADPYIINSVKDLILFRDSVNAGETKYNAPGVYVALGADIDLGGAAWHYINNFYGKFDGKDHTISNFTIDATEGHAAFFYKTASKDGVTPASIENLILSDITATVGKNCRVAALVVSYNKTDIKNVTVKKFTVTTTGATSWIAGLACSGTVNSEVTMSNCTVEDFTVNDAYGAQFISGITAVMQRNGTEADGTNGLENLHVKNFKVVVNGIVANGSSTAVGGLIGQTQSVWQNPHFKNCSVTDLDVTATGRVDVGGFMAHPGSWTYTTNCTVAGKIDVTGVTSDSNYAGGFYGDYGWGDNVSKGDHVATNCSANVEIITKFATAGGFVGSGTNTENRNKDIILNNCKAEGAVTVVEGGSATIGGFAGNADRGIYNACSAPEGLPFIGKVLEGKNTEVTCVASVGNTYYATLKEAINAAKTGDVVKLLVDVTLTDADIWTVGSYNVILNVEGKDITLDMNGKKITVDYNGTSYKDLIAVVRVADGAGLTVKGNGTIDIPENGINIAYMFWKAGTTGHLTIEDGTYHMDDSADSMVYTNGHKIVTVLGGTWTLDKVGTRANSFPCFFNVQGAGDHSIIIKGGTYNDDINHQYWGNEAVVDKTCYVVDNGDGTWTVKEGAVAYVNLGTLTGPYFVAKEFGFATFEEAWAAAQDGNGNTVTLLTDITLDKMLVNTKKVILNLNGKTITGTDTTSKNFSLIDNRGELTITGNGKMTLTATVDSGTGRYSAVIANNPGGKLIVENGTIEHLGGTYMAYGIDNLTNGKGTYAETIINGGTIKSTYRGIRQFLNGVEAENILTITGGTVEGANKAIFFHDPSKNANSGTLTVAAAAVINGNVYLFVTEGSTEWPVTVSIAASALKNGSTVDSKNVPDGYEVRNVNGTYGVKKVNYVTSVNGERYESLQAAINAASSGDTITFLADITENVTINKDLTIDGAGNKYTGNIGVKGSTVDVIVKNVNFVNGDGYAITSSGVKSITVTGCTVDRYAYGFLYVKSATPTVAVKDVTVSNCNYGFHYVYGNQATLENVTMTNVSYGIYVQNYADKTVTIKNSSLTSIGIWERDGKSGVQTFKFEGVNKVATLSTSVYAKYVGVQLGTDNIYYCGSLAEAFAAAEDDDIITLLSNVTLDAPVIVEGKVKLDLAGFTITGTDNNESGNFYLFNMKKGSHLTINDSEGSGKITLVATVERNWSSSSVVIANNQGTLVVNGGTIEHLGGTSMAYAIDNLTNSGIGEATTIINGGNIQSTYFAIRQFANCKVCVNELVIKGGTIGYAWMQSPNSNVNKVAIEISGGKLDGFCFSGVNADVTFNADADCVGEVYGTMPTGTALVVVNGEYTLVPAVATIGNTGYATLEEAFAAAKAGDVVTVFAGTYAMPAMKAGITIVGSGDVIFEGTLTGTLENLTLKNIHIKGGNAQRWAYAKGDLWFENVTFEATSVYALHFDGITAGSNLTYKNCTVIGWAAMSGSPESVVFDGCTFKGNGTYGLIRTYFDATIKDCTFDVANVNSGDVYQDGIHAVGGAVVTVDNCTNVNGDMMDIINTDSTAFVKLDGKLVHTLAGSGTETDPYVINNVGELIYFRDSVNAGETKYNASGVYVALTADIDLMGIDWSVNIGDDCITTFDGIFDGQGHIISNLTSTETAKKADGYVCAGLFGAIYGSAVIKNLTIKNVAINTGDFTGNNVGAVVGFAYNCTGSIENVKVVGDIRIDASGIYGVGAIVGYDYYSPDLRITGCEVVGNDGSYIKAVSGVGGVVGYSNGITVSDCKVENVAISALGLVGGIAGIALAKTVVKNVTVKNVTLTATKAEWVNSTAVTIGTIAGNGVTVSGVTAENVNATRLVGSAYLEKPTAVVPAVEAKIGDRYYITLQTAIKAAVAGDIITILADVAIPDGYLKAVDAYGNVICVKNEWFNTVSSSFLVADPKTGKATFRFTYHFNSDLTIENFWSDSDWGWTYWFANDETNTVTTYGNTITSTNRTSIRFDNLPKEYFGREFCVQLHFKVTIGDVEYTVYDKVRTISVYALAEMYIDAYEKASDKAPLKAAYDYAVAIMAYKPE